jgi:molybdenum cofactor guanylyltransferase
MERRKLRVRGSGKPRECIIGDVDDVTAFVLAGGKSTRMGQDKAFLELDGRSLLARAIEKAKGITDEVCIVGERAKFSRFGVTIEDVYRERGPLGAIHAALAASASEWNFVLAVDMPFVEKGFPRWLIGEARKGDALVTVPRAGGLLQPLCGVYRKNFGEIARRSLESGENKIDRLFANIPKRIIEEEQLTKAGFSSEMFRNLNTPEEWKEVSSDGQRAPRKKVRTRI